MFKFYMCGKNLPNLTREGRRVETDVTFSSNEHEDGREKKLCNVCDRYTTSMRYWCKHTNQSCRRKKPEKTPEKQDPRAQYS